MPTIKRAAVSKETLLDPKARVWREAEAVTLQLQPTPVGMQPSEYIRTTVEQASVGTVKQLEVRALHNGSELFVRLEWPDPDKDDDAPEPHLFADGAAVMFPFGEDAPLITMGSQAQPVNQWHWRADLEKPYNLTTAGLGTTYRTPESFIEAKAVWERGRWAVVLARAVETPDPDNHVPFRPGQAVKAAFCVWKGSQQERAGIKAYSPAWTEFTLEA
jgi:DMSO reductase family type II enzyme heme b subunit